MSEKPDPRLLAAGWKVLRVFTHHDKCCHDWKCGAPDRGIVGYEYGRA